MLGSILLCESAYAAAQTPEKFMKIFEALSVPLADCCTNATNRFKISFATVKADPQAHADSSHQSSQQVQQDLMVIQSWVRMHERLLERFESQMHFGFDHFIRSNAYSNAFTSLLGININDESNPAVATLLSFSGLQTIDEQLNTTKSKALECLKMLSENIFSTMSDEQMQGVPYTHKLQALTPTLIQTAEFVSTHAEKHAMIQDPVVSEFLVQLMAVLILLTGENTFFDVFANNMAKILVSICLNLMVLT